MTNFKNYLNIFANAMINVELIDYGDSLQSIYNINYTANDFVQDVKTISNAYYNAYINGPGISEHADSSWISQLETLYDNYGSTFTFRCIIFKNSS